MTAASENGRINSIMQIVKKEKVAKIIDSEREDFYIEIWIFLKKMYEKEIWRYLGGIIYWDFENLTLADESWSKT